MSTTKSGKGTKYGIHTYKILPSLNKTEDILKDATTWTVNTHWDEPYQKDNYCMIGFMCSTWNTHIWKNRK